MRKLNKIAAGVGAALALSYGVPSHAVIGTPGALGDAFLHFTNTAFAVGDGALGPSGIPIAALVAAGVLTISSSGFETATTQAVLNGTAGVAVGNGSYPLGTGFTATTTVGAGFAPGGPEAAVTGNPPVLTSGGGGYSKSTGNSTTGTAAVFIHSLSQLDGGGDTNASADQDLQTEFGITVAAGPGVLIELSYDLERLVRAGLGQNNIKSFAQTTFSVTVTDIATGATIYNWTPNGLFVPGLPFNGGFADNSGTCFLTLTCTTYADPFSMQDGRTVNGTTDDRAAGNAPGFVGPAALQIGYFESELFLAPGDYTVQISGNATTNASILPEPGSIALLGLGLLGLGLVSRRKMLG
jgi:hypothetical protein